MLKNHNTETTKKHKETRRSQRFSALCALVNLRASVLKNHNTESFCWFCGWAFVDLNMP